MVDGQQVRYEDRIFAVDTSAGDERQLALVAVPPETGTVLLYRVEFLAKVAQEQILLVDDDAGSEAHRVSETTIDITHLTPARQLDWYFKLIVLRHLLPYSRCSPRSVMFRTAVVEALSLLAEVRGSYAHKGWSAKTLNDDLRRWCVFQRS